MSPIGRRPATFGADAVHHHFVVRPQIAFCLIVGRSDVTRRVHGNRLLRFGELLERSLVELDEGQEPMRTAADNRQRERESVSCCAQD